MGAATLILGATGGFGGAAAMELLNRGRPVRLLVRDVTKARARFGNRANGEIIEGDVQDAAAVARAADGCDAIIHAVNYPFHKWVPAMGEATANVIAAAERTGSTVLFPGNVYALGRATGLVPDDAPNNPTTRKGAVCAALEDALREAATQGRCRSVVLRAGDYFGPMVRNGLVDPLFGAALAGRPLRYPGSLDADHQWAYTPDLARAAVALLDARAELAPFEVVNFAGYIARPQRSLLDLIATQAGHPGLNVTTLPWCQVRLAGLWNPAARELMELRYLFDSAVVLEEKRLRELVPDLPQTPVEAAVKTTLASYRRWTGAGPGPAVRGQGGGSPAG